MHTAPNPLVFTAEIKGAHSTSDSVTCNNSEDILTQSQMFKASDMDAFLGSQQAEITNLLKTDVMEPHPIHDLPP
jgi:hypothetical protein